MSRLLTFVGVALGVTFVAADDPATIPLESDVDLSRVEQQAERVMNAGLPFAEMMLEKHREFAPFGAVMLPSGLIQTVGANDVRETAPIEEIYERLQQGLLEGIAESAYIALATFTMVEMRAPDSGEQVTAVHVAIEHQEGYCVDVFYPTVLRGEGLVLGESFAAKRAGTYFDACR